MPSTTVRSTPKNIHPTPLHTRPDSAAPLASVILSVAVQQKSSGFNSKHHHQHNDLCNDFTVRLSFLLSLSVYSSYPLCTFRHHPLGFLPSIFPSPTSGVKTWQHLTHPALPSFVNGIKAIALFSNQYLFVGDAQHLLLSGHSRCVQQN